MSRKEFYPPRRQLLNRTQCDIAISRREGRSIAVELLLTDATLAKVPLAVLSLSFEFLDRS